LAPFGDSTFVRIHNVPEVAHEGFPVYDNVDDGYANGNEGKVEVQFTPVAA
jgi:hypothetical protein